MAISAFHIPEPLSFRYTHEFGSFLPLSPPIALVVDPVEDGAHLRPLHHLHR